MENLLIDRVLPHRYPFLFVDRIDELEPGRRIVATRAVAHDDRWLTADASGTRWMPATILLECVSQVGAVLVLSTPEWRDRLAYLVGIDRVRIRGAVRGGDVVRIHVSLDRMIGPVGRMTGSVFVDGRRIARGRVRFALGPVRSTDARREQPGPETRRPT